MGSRLGSLSRPISRFAFASPLDALLPLKGTWWAVFGVPLVATLHWLVIGFSAWPITLAIGPFGIAVVALTVLVRLVLLPLSLYQVRVALRQRRETLALHRRLAPRVEALRRRHRRRPADFQRAVADLVREQAPGALAGQGRTAAIGLLVAAVQAPLLIALYWAILGLAHGGAPLHFLWVASLASPDALLLPVLAGLSTYLVTRLAAALQPPPLAESEEQAGARRLTAIVYPAALMISAHFAPAALALYWVTGNLVAAGQQWVVNRLALRPAAAGA